MTRRCEHGSEAILILMACLSPWAFGAVEAWAALVLAALVLGLGLLWALSGAARRLERPEAHCCLPGLALAGLVLLAFFQAAPLTEGLLRLFSPGAAALRGSLMPGAPEAVAGDPVPAVPLPAATVSQDPEATRHAAIWLLAASVVLQSVLGLSSGRQALRRFCLALGVNAGLVALSSLLQALTWNGKIYGWRSSPYGSAGPFVSHNHLAAYLNLGLGAVLGFLLAPGQGGGGRKLWPAYGAILIVAGVVGSLSRSGFLAMAGAGIVVGVLLLRKSWGAKRFLALASVAGLLAVFLLVIGRAIPFPDRLGTLLASSSYGGRAAIWRDAVRAWPAYPVWGTGLGSFAVAAAPYFRTVGPVRYTHAENEYIEGLVEGGLAGAGLGLALLVGIVRLGHRAFVCSGSSQERALLVGVGFSGLTLLIQSAGDFAPHIPAVGLTAVILAGLVVRCGLDAAPLAPPRAASKTILGRLPLAGALVTLASLAVVIHAVARARAECVFLAAGIELCDNGPLVRIQERFTRNAHPVPAASEPELEQLQQALEQALRIRPDWAEGHLRLGLLQLHAYERRAADAVAGQVEDPASRSLLASPLWLHNVIHAGRGARPSDANLASLGPIRDHLVPAARSFLEARRCCPVLALPHAELATLDFLLPGESRGAEYIERAVRLAGANKPLIALATQLALQLGRPDLTARGLRKALETGALAQNEVADLAGLALTGDEILREVCPDGRAALEFCDRLYAAPDEQGTRETFLRGALERWGDDPTIPTGARLELEAQLRKRLGDRSCAQDRMERALRLEPRRAAWRKDLVMWLIAWGRPREAHEQALAGLEYAPRSPETHAALEAAAEAMARGGTGVSLADQVNPN
jgi:O-antigen ligase